MLLSDAIMKFFPELARPDLTRKKSKSHWRRSRNKTRREKAAHILAENKSSIIIRRLIHGKEDFPILWIGNDDLDVEVTKEYDTVEIDISNEDLLTHDIEIVGDCCDEDLTVLIKNLIDRVANQKQ